MDTATMRCTTNLSYAANNAVNKPCFLRRERPRCSATTSTWSTTGLLLLLFCCLSAAEAAGLWGLGSGSAAQRGSTRQSIGPDDDNMDEVFAKVQQDEVCRVLISKAAGAASSAGVLFSR